jgi:hypothetical protein
MGIIEVSGDRHGLFVSGANQLGVRQR